MFQVLLISNNTVHIRALKRFIVISISQILTVNACNPVEAVV